MNSPALKEWGAAVQALLDGRQTVLLRKGGIGEKRFEVSAPEFVFFPTVEHSHAQRVRPEFTDLLVRAAGDSTDTEVVVRGGASTVRVLPEDPESQDPNEIASTLLAFGCRVELGPGGMLAASIGADCPREGITQWLAGLEEQGAIQLAPGYMA